MTESDLTQAHRLSVSVGWSHRLEDWQFLFATGHGFVACDGIGRAFGSAMWWPFGDDFGTVGMVITSPRLQSQGAGRQLMDAIFAQTGPRDLRLNSTKAGYALYCELGFETVGRVFPHQGRAQLPEQSEGPGEPARIMGLADLAAIAELDALAFGADRTRVIAELIGRSTITISEREGKTAGFAICNRFGRGHVVGPMVARDDAMAIELMRPHVEAHAGMPLRVDTTQQTGPFRHFLESCGMMLTDSLPIMARGRHHGSRGGVSIYGLVNQALG